MKYEIKTKDGDIIILKNVRKINLFGFAEVYEFFMTDGSTKQFEKDEVFSFIEIME
jgi:hypothetical protein